MRFLPYFILAYLTLGIQIGLGEYVSWNGAKPNLVLLAVLFIALHAPREQALLGAFTLGLLQDMLTYQPLGLYALAYGLVALLVTGAGHGIGKEHPLTHVGLALLGGLVTALVLAAHVWLRPPGPALQSPIPTAAVRGPVGPIFLSAVYTAILAPAVLWALHRCRKAFGFQPGARRGYR